MPLIRRRGSLLAKLLGVISLVIALVTAIVWASIDFFVFDYFGSLLDHHHIPEKMKVLESAMEGPFYDFNLGADLNGDVKTKECETELKCKNITVKITPDVRAILNGKEVPLGYFIKSSHQPSSLHFNNATKKLARITWISPTSTKR